MRFAKNLFLLLIFCFPVISLASESNPCDNFTGLWQGKSIPNNSSDSIVYYKWNVLEKYQETASVEAKFSYDGHRYSKGNKIIVICKNALMQFNGYQGTIFDNKIHFSFPHETMDLTKKS